MKINKLLIITIGILFFLNLYLGFTVRNNQTQADPSVVARFHRVV
jgi:hypothetical protein